MTTVIDERASWQTLKVDDDYEICVEYPYPIRRRDNGRVVSEWIGANGYPFIALNRKIYRKHRVIAEQWVDNDDPEHMTQVDHRNRDRTDYHVTNLHWVTSSQNNLNRTGRGDIRYEYVDDLPLDVVPINMYKGVEYEGYSIDSNGDIWFYNDEQFRKLHADKDNRVSMYDIYHKRHRVRIDGIRAEFL